MPAMRLRFSIRWVLIFFAASALLLWWHCGPSRISHQLATALRAGDFKKARTFYSDQVIDDSLQDHRRHVLHRTDVFAVSPTAAEWLTGRRRLLVAFFGVFSPEAHRVEVLTITASGVSRVDVECDRQFGVATTADGLILPRAVSTPKRFLLPDR